ncbi:MAG: amino acid ABC transporter permease [Acidobacteriaceae bacterium]|nr:amino acid ABC transporter permease [Acidobacteriaceae bacterium]
MSYNWDFSALGPYKLAFLQGACWTLYLGAVSSAAGSALGIPMALLLRQHPVVSVPLGLAIDALRAIPNLVLILGAYYFPYSRLFGIPGPSPLVASLIGLTVAQLAYSADLIRSAIEAVPANQVLSARALGFREWQVARWVVFPSVVRQVLPSHMALWIGNVKLSSLASTIGVHESVWVAQVAMSTTFRSLEAWMTVGAIYIVLVTPLTLLARRVERSSWLRHQ